MKNKIYKYSLLWIALLISSCNSIQSYNDGYIQYAPVRISETDKQILLKSIEQMDSRYDPVGKMITTELKGWNYHTDALSGTFHEVRASFSYAVNLLDCGEKKYEQRAFDIINKTISLQDTDTNSPSCGVWPYYEEEPLATKKSPIDYNWADFNAVSLLDIYMGHKDKLPNELLKKIENALILAAKSIRKRNCGPGYTNIAIMGTYVTYVTSYLFNMPDMQNYANKRLKNFYDYTLEKGGFSEYNSPTYSIVAIDELNRMQRHIVEPNAKRMIDDLYAKCWEIIARHYHQSSVQWAGPHSRSYSTLVSTSYYGLLKKASSGKIDLGYNSTNPDIKITHHIPDNLLSYFLTPQYPRTERDIFEKVEPQIIGTTYLTDQYAIGTVSRSSMWNQRRPLTVYWGQLNHSHYMQVRMLHDFYDFSTASIFTQQDKNNVLSVINFGTNGGDKHINIDRLKDGTFKAKDLRIRFEFGNCKNVSVNLPVKTNEAFTISAEGANLGLQMLEAKWDHLQGYWEKGNDEQNCWVDYIIYSGEEKIFNLTEVQQAVYAFALSFGSITDKLSIKNASSSITNGLLTATWNDLMVKVPVKPDKLPHNL